MRLSELMTFIPKVEKDVTLETNKLIYFLAIDCSAGHDRNIVKIQI